MRYGTVCSGIEAPSIAWEPLGWTPQWFSEIAPFPCAVLAHRFPHVPNVGDMTKLDEVTLEPIDVLMGGTPCLSFSVSGLRGGMADARGQLAFEFCRLAARTRPRWVVWENVPGVLSADGGRAFGSIVGALAELGYGWAYRILDAQYLGVPQRRRRVFLAGHLGDWRRAAAVLFERHSLSGNPPPSRGARPDVASALGGGPHGGGWRLGAEEAAGGQLVARTVQTRGGQRMDIDKETFVTHALKGCGFDASEDGTGRGTPLVTAFHMTQDPISGTCAPSLGRTSSGMGVAVANLTQMTHRENRAHVEPGRPSPPADGSGGLHLVTPHAVRRLLPVECERLQGLPDGWTDVPYRGKPASDGPRYEAIGNSIAVPCLRWIGERIAKVELDMLARGGVQHGT